MNGWTRHIITKQGFPIKVYIKENSAVIFYCFGRYSKCQSDDNVIDFVTDFLFGNGQNFVSFNSYVSAIEDTAVINIENVAA